MSRNIIVTVLVIVLLIGGYFLLTSEKAVAPGADEVVGSETGTYPVGTDIPDADLGTAENKAATVITYTDAGFSPTPVTIKVGDTVTFKNASAVDMWPASAMHPTHTVYPGSDIKKCGTAQEAGIFDACRGIKPLSSWSYTFTEKGSWNYHDHLNAKYFGKVIVE